jgi:hypothetical protein
MTIVRSILLVGISKMKTSNVTPLLNPGLSLHNKYLSRLRGSMLGSHAHVGDRKSQLFASADMDALYSIDYQHMSGSLVELANLDYGERSSVTDRDKIISRSSSLRVKRQALLSSTKIIEAPCFENLMPSDVCNGQESNLELSLDV